MSSDLPKRLRMCFSVQDDSEAAIIAEAAAEIERLERALAEWKESRDYWQQRALTAESSLAQLKARMAEIHDLISVMCGDGNEYSALGAWRPSIDRIAILSTDKDTA